MGVYIGISITILVIFGVSSGSSNLRRCCRCSCSCLYRRRSSSSDGPFEPVIKLDCNTDIPPPILATLPINVTLVNNVISVPLKDDIAPPCLKNGDYNTQARTQE